MTGRICPVPGCGRGLGSTRHGDPFAFCGAHYHRLSRVQQQRLWQAYKAWQRLERQRLNVPAGERIPRALLLAIAVAIQGYLDVRGDCVRAVKEPDEQLEFAQ